MPITLWDANQNGGKVLGISDGLSMKRKKEHWASNGIINKI